MPRFYFDFSEGDSHSEDDEGTELPDLDEARAEAIEALVAMGKDYRERVARGLAVNVRDKTGKHLFRATLRITIEDLT
jgi:hypothetical protein